MEKAKTKKFKCDILSNFQIMCTPYKSLIWSYKIRFTDLVEEGTEAPPLMSIKKLKIKAEFSADVLTNMECAL